MNKKISSLTIENASMNKELFLALLDNEHEVELNFSGIQDMDMSGLQLLISFMKDAEKKQKKVVFTGGLSVNVQRTIELCGLVEHLGEQAASLAQILRAV